MRYDATLYRNYVLTSAFVCSERSSLLRRNSCNQYSAQGCDLFNYLGVEIGRACVHTLGFFSRPARAFISTTDTE